ncbi:MAG: hypothetical protein RLZZ522_521 [Verrucomicrobiota bacterium]|jgi:hypothetical protein
MSKWNDGENPLETLKFLKENGRNYDEGNFKALAQQDPWAALDWIKENPGVQLDRYRSGKDAMSILVATMSTEHPDDLQRLAEQTPSGEMKRKMEAALFESLLATDPAAAIEQAKTTESPAIASQRFVKIGLALLKSDPDQAFEMGRNLLAGNPSGINNSVRVDYPNGNSSWGGSSDGSSDLLSALVAKDPARVMAMAIQPGEKPTNSFYSVADQWASQNLVSYSQWVNELTDPDIRKSAVAPIISGLMELNQFSEAADWAMSIDHSDLNNFFNVLQSWKRVDPEGAATWLETASLPENKRAMFQKFLQPKQSSGPTNPTEE